MYYLLMKVRDEKEMKLIYFSFYWKNTDKMVKYKGCYIKRYQKLEC